MSIIQKGIWAGALAALCLSGAAQADDAADVKAAIQRWQDLFNAGDGAAAAQEIYTEDARLLPPDAPMIEGREAVAQFWQAVMDSPVHSLALGGVALEVAGDTAIETGTWSITVPKEGGGEMQVGGKALVIWKKGADGAWRMSQDMWNDGN